jgi:mono/diheme cytochrome c family protein
VGKGRIPGLTPGKLDWSAQDIEIFLQSGVKPNFDTAGGQMAEVVENWSQLTDADRADVAAYLKALPGG